MIVSRVIKTTKFKADLLQRYSHVSQKIQNFIPLLHTSDCLQSCIKDGRLKMWNPAVCSKNKLLLSHRPSTSFNFFCLILPVIFFSIRLCSFLTFYQNPSNGPIISLLMIHFGSKKHFDLLAFLHLKSMTWLQLINNSQWQAIFLHYNWGRAISH